MPSETDSDFKGKYLRQLPSVGKLMEHPELERMLETCPRVVVIEAVQYVIDAHKVRILAAEDEERLIDMDLSFENIVEAAAVLAAENARMSLRRAINATGDVLSVNLGKAPLNMAAQKSLQDVSSGYSTLAIDMETGGRGDRNAHVQRLLSSLTGAETGLILNNNAAAVMLNLNTIADGKEVIVSRGQLIENDGFRLPEIIPRSGAEMVPVGATNRTHPRDYRNAINENTGAILRVNKSDYRIAGFSQDVPIRELAKIGKEHNIPVIDDIGGGCLIDLAQHGLPEQSPAFLSIKDGADMVCFSGDELLSGPQAGIIIGSEEYISMMTENPLYRVLRAGKLIIAALEATLRSYLDTDRILEANPALRMLSRSLEEIESATHSLANSLIEKMTDLAVIDVKDGHSQISSTSAPWERFPTKLMTIKPTKISAEKLCERLRSLAVPVFVIVSAEQILMDLRTVQDDEMEEIVTALAECCQP